MLLIISLVIGITGFHWIEGYSFTDAFYMCVITISTVGFSTVRELSAGGKIFVSLYIIFNLFVLAYGLSVITSYIFEGGLRSILHKYKTNQGIRKMKNHVIVCGYGRNGSKACAELLQNKKDFIVIENDPEVISLFPHDKDIHFIHGDATMEEILQQAGVDRAEYVITTLARDSDNVYITLTAKEFNPSVKVISRASDILSGKKLARAGAFRVVMPDVLGGLHMAQLITKPYVIEFLDLLNGVGNESLSVEEITYSELKKEFRDKTIADLHIRNNTGVTVIGFKNRGKFFFNPGPETMLVDDTIIIVVGDDVQLDKFRRHYMK
jgi:voltage-gated potassium channel